MIRFRENTFSSAYEKYPITPAIENVDPAVKRALRCKFPSHFGSTVREPLRLSTGKIEQVFSLEPATRFGHASPESGILSAAKFQSQSRARLGSASSAGNPTSYAHKAPCGCQVRIFRPVSTCRNFTCDKPRRSRSARSDFCLSRCCQPRYFSRLALRPLHGPDRRKTKTIQELRQAMLHRTRDRG